MVTYREQLEALETLKVRPGDSKRIDCLFCGGKKTLGVIRKDGDLVWNCFKASCGARGKKQEGRTASEIRSRCSALSKSPKQNLTIPEILSDPLSHPQVLRYIKDVQVLPALEARRIRIEYAPGERRVLFFFPEQEGAVGRTMSGVKPKWKAYGDTSGCLFVGSGDTAVIVEDAASACAVSNVEGFVGASLSGTNLSMTQKMQLLRFNKILVALDPDAANKALKIADKLAGLVNTSVRFLPGDPKEFDSSSLGRLLRG